MSTQRGNSMTTPAERGVAEKAPKSGHGDLVRLLCGLVGMVVVLASAGFAVGYLI